MSILSEIATYLDSKPNVRQAINGRVYAGRAPQGARMPYILLDRIATTRIYTTLGEIAVAQPVIQVDVFTTSHLEADEIAELIRDAMSSYVGLMGTTTVQGCTIERDNQQVFRPEDGSDTWTYMRSLDFRLTHSQTVPAL